MARCFGAFRQKRSSDVLPFRPGDVLELSDPGPHGIGTIQHRCRVILADHVQVMYEPWWQHLEGGCGGWGYRSLRKAIYYRIGLSALIANSRFVRHETLSSEELALHRPDLPLRALCGTGWTWDRVDSPSLGDFARRTADAGLPAAVFDAKPLLSLGRVWLRPIGPRGGPKSPVLVESERSDGFGGLELLWRAHRIQAPYAPVPWVGAGIYREGFYRGAPSFLIGGDRDFADSLPI